MEVVAAPFPVSWDVDRNLQYVERAMEGCRPGDLVVFPEGALSGYSDDLSGLRSLDAPRLAAALDAVHGSCASRKVHVVIGTLWPGAARWTNTAVYLDPTGHRQWYEKVNLAYHERGVLDAGSRLPVFAIGGTRVGIQMCRELRYPEQWRWLSLSGAQLLLYLTHAVGDPLRLPVWRSHLVSRAAENQRFVLGVNSAHEMQSCPSIIVDPKGGVLGELRGGEASLLRASLDLSEVSDWYLSQARTDLLSLRSGST